jgi:hypothetical protein
MRLTTQERLAQKPASKIAGVIYIMLGVFALFVAAFVALMQGVLGEITSFRLGLGIVIALYGVFRIITGIITFRKAGKGNILFDGKDVPL